MVDNNEISKTTIISITNRYVFHLNPASENKHSASASKRIQQPQLRVPHTQQIRSFAQSWQVQRTIGKT